MYNSKYYTCEQIDQRLLEGYYDDAVAAGYTGSKAQYLAGLLKAINYSANPTLTSDNVIYDPSASGLVSKNVKAALDELVRKFSGGLADGAVTKDKLATGAVTSEKIAEGAITKDKLSPETWLPIKRGLNSDGTFVNNSITMGYNSEATLPDSTAFGYSCKAYGDSSHAEGTNNTASGNSSHAEGTNNTASGSSSHAEGNNTTASGSSSHAEGSFTIASGNEAHVEGYNTEAKGNRSHAEGQETHAEGICSHTEGYQTQATGNYSHVEGMNNLAKGFCSHAEGKDTNAIGNYSHAQGVYNYAANNFLHMIGIGNEDYRKNACVIYVKRGSGGIPDLSDKKTGYMYLLGVGDYAGQSVTDDMKSVQEVLADYDNKISNTNTRIAQIPVKKGSGIKSAVEGDSTTASGNYSHAEGDGTTASGARSHAEGYKTEAKGDSSHAEGHSTTASGEYSHTEGLRTIASGARSHAEGDSTTASGAFSHAEGDSTTASGARSHAEGFATTASGAFSHAEGHSTTASGNYSHAEGVINYDDESFISMIGIGTGMAQKNAVVVYVGRDSYGDIDISAQKHGYQYLLDVGGYQGQEIGDAKSVQEVFADLTSRIEALEAKLADTTAEEDKQTN